MPDINPGKVLKGISPTSGPTNRYPSHLIGIIGIVLYESIWPVSSMWIGTRDEYSYTGETTRPNPLRL
jgi:hypothetical protein